jgi:hypothetical protein
VVNLLMDETLGGGRTEEGGARGEEVVAGGVPLKSISWLRPLLVILFASWPP